LSIEEAQTITGTGYPATQQALLRLSRAGWVVRLGAGKYALVPPSAGDDAIPEANRLVIARELMGVRFLWERRAWFRSSRSLTPQYRQNLE